MWIDRRLLIAAVAGSILLNVLLLGIVFGHVFGHVFAGPRHPRLARGGGLILRAHVKALPPDERRAFEAALAPHRPAIRAARDAHRAARQTTEADIAAATFDRGKVVSDLDALRQANARVSEALDGALTDGLAALSPESRAALVQNNAALPRP